jgi:hypothetical protein
MAAFLSDEKAKSREPPGVPIMMAMLAMAE